MINWCRHAAGPKEKLDSTAVSQPAIFVASLAALAALRKQDDSPVASCDVAAGLSLGEYTALTFADVMSFEDGLKLVRSPCDVSPLPLPSQACPGTCI